MSIAEPQSGYGISLHPVDKKMSKNIVSLRRSSHASGFITETSPDISLQNKWISRQRARPLDHYWCIRNDHSEFLGTIAIYESQHDEDGTMRAEWGRWVVLPGSPVALGSFILMLKTGFDVLHYKSLYSATVATNSRALHFHRRIKTPEVGTTYRVVSPGSSPVRMVEHVIERKDWQKNKESWQKAALSLEERVRNYRPLTSN